MTFSKQKTALAVALFAGALLVLYASWPAQVIRHQARTDDAESRLDKSGPVRLAAESVPVVVRKKISDPPTETEPTDRGDRPLVITKKVPPEAQDIREPAAALPASEATPVPAGVAEEAPRPEPDRLEVAGAQQKAETVGAADPSGMEAATPEPAAPPVMAQLPEETTPPSLKAGAEPQRDAGPQAEKKPAMLEKPAAHTFNEKVSPRPYSIMLASCRRLDSARKVVAAHRRKGLSPYIVRVDLGSKGVWWRVLDGSFSGVDEAGSVKAKYDLQEAIVTKTPYAVMIGQYAGREAAAQEVRRLEKLNYSPYFIEAPDNQVRLMVGAFLTGEGARKLGSELDARGISNTVVTR